MPSTILVTGANKGIGFEAVKLLAQRKPDSTILLGSRSTKNGEDAIAKMKSSASGHDFSNVKVVELDVTDHSSLVSAAEHVKSTYKSLDVLINNSGISSLNGNGKAPEIFDVNVRGAKDCIETFLPLIPKNSGKVILVSSEVGTWYTYEVDESVRAKLMDIPVKWEKIEGWMKDWETFAAGGKAEEKWVPLEKGLAGAMYCASKALVNPYIRTFAAEHPEIKVAVVCPGYCATDLNNFQGPRTAEQGGESIIFPVDGEFESGKFYQDGKEHPFSQAMPAQFKH